MPMAVTDVSVSAGRVIWRLETAGPKFGDVGAERRLLARRQCERVSASEVKAVWLRPAASFNTLLPQRLHASRSFTSCLQHAELLRHSR